MAPNSGLRTAKTGKIHDRKCPIWEEEKGISKNGTFRGKYWSYLSIFEIFIKNSNQTLSKKHLERLEYLSQGFISKIQSPLKKSTWKIDNQTERLDSSYSSPKEHLKTEKEEFRR